MVASEVVASAQVSLALGALRVMPTTVLRYVNNVHVLYLRTVRVWT